MALRSRVKSFTLGLKIITEGVMRRAMITNHSDYLEWLVGSEAPNEPFNWDPPVDPSKPPYQAGKG